MNGRLAMYRPPHQSELAGGVANPLEGIDMPDRTCIWDDCQKPPIARGYCSPHYAKARKRGMIEPLPPPDHEALFWAKVDKLGPDECWLWTAYKRPAGYGTIGTNRGGHKQAHRVAYEMLVRPIPEGLELDHLCRVTSCVNPAHLEPVTRAENRRREMAAARAAGNPGNACGRRPTVNRKPRALLDACRRGHLFDEANTGRLPNGKRRCRACHRENERTRQEAQRRAAGKAERPWARVEAVVAGLAS